jgi:hypothetical protein
MLTSGLYGKDLSNSFNSAIVAPAQKIKPKVIIKWLDSRHLDNLVVTTNDAPAVNSYPSRGFFFPASEAFNGIRRQSFTWAVAGALDADGDVIRADGSWYAMPSLTTNDLSNTQMGSSLEFGWWSNSVSNSNTHATYDGYGFVTSPYIQATFTTRKVNKIRIITSEFYGQISTYLLQAYDGSLNLILNETGTITDDGYDRDHILSEALSTNNISKIKVTVYTTKNPGDYARIQEIVPIYEEDISEYVMSYSVNRTRDIHSTSLPIGGSETASVDLKLDNTGKLFNIFNSASTYGKYMAKDLEVEIYTGWRIKKPSSDYLNSSVLTTQLQANISNSSSTFSVLDKSSLPSGGAGNYFTVVIDKGTQSEEVILCSSVDSSSVVTVLERGYGDTIAKSHTVGATISFDIYEYVKNGTFYVDEWTVGTDMTVGANLQDWSKFLSERSINYGFFLQNAYVGDAVKNLLMRANFPSADIKKLNTYKQGAKDREAVSLYSFNEQTIDRSGNSIIPSTGLRARFWGMPTNQKNIQSVKDIVADAIDKELSPMDKALGEKSFVSPTLTLLSKSISTSNTSALDISNYSFTGNDSAVYSEYFNGVFDGYYIPTDSGLQKLIVFISYGGVRLYLDDILILDKYQTTTSSTRYESSMVNLSAGVPRKIRIEFFHSFNNSGSASFSISLYKALSGGSDAIVSAAECCTIVPLDAIGSKNSSSTWSTADSYNHRNNGVYINNPKLSQPTGLVSDQTDKSVLLENNAYIRIPYTATNDLSTKNEWTMEFFGKFHAQNVGAAPAPITVTNSGASSYLINGVSNATISMVRGGLYTLQVNATGHPFWIQTSAGAYNAANVVASGIINNGSAVGTITFQVPANAPSTLYYACQHHAAMAGTITITGAANPYESILGDGEYISNWSNSIATSGFEFFNNSVSHGFRLKTVLANSAVVTETVSSNTALSNSSSYHIVSVYDGSDLKYYVNGVLQDTEVIEGTPVSWASKDTTIGGRGASFASGVEVTPPTIRSFYVDEFAVYDKALTSENIKDRYIESAMQPLTQFAFLYGNETSIREIMNDITFADMGRIYIDENDKAKYEHFYRFFEPSIDQHANVQSYFSDSTNITNSNYNVSLQCNKVVIPISSIQTSTNAVQSLWIAPDGSSLATTKLTSNLASNANVAYVSTTLDPVYADTGYIKINSEIIKYISKTATSFNGLERAQYQTTAAAHVADDKVRESRYYDIKFDKAPAYNIKAPFISAILFENPKKVEITKYLPYPYGAEMILSASEDSEVGGLVFLQGTDPLTKYPYATVLSGTAVMMSEQNVQVKEQSASLADSIKKYGVKDVTIQSPFITDSVHAKKLADFIIEKTQIPVPIINLDVTAMPKIQLGDRIRVTNLSALDITNTDYWVISHNTTIGDNVSQNLVLRKVS